MSSWWVSRASIIPLIPSPGSPKIILTPQSISVSIKISAAVFAKSITSRHARATISVACKRNRAQQCVRRLPGIETRMLHHDGNIRFNHARIICSPWKLRVEQIVKAQVFCSLSRNVDHVGTQRLAIAEINADLHVRIAVSCVQNAGSLVTQHLRFWSGLSAGI